MAGEEPSPTESSIASMLEPGRWYKFVYMDMEPRVISGEFVKVTGGFVWVQQRRDTAPTAIALSIIRRIEPQARDG